jgi:hypothetical protein
MNLRIVVMLLASLFYSAFAADAAVSSPEIVSTRFRVVRVKVPAGFESVTLQHKSARRGHPWETMAVSPAKASGGVVVFRTKQPLPRRMLRVLGTRPGQVPSNFLTGVSEFFPPEGASSITLGTTGAGGGLALDSGVAATATTTSAEKISTGDSAPRTVVESDIWKLSGDRLYLYNQYRGLQVLDVKDPAKPALLGTLALPASGEDLYELADGHVALLANRPYVLGWNVDQPAGAEGSVIICDTTAGAPKVVATLPIAGEVLESRLVGSALYVATRLPDVTTNTWYYRTKIQITGFDLSNPAAPVVRNTVTLRTPDGDGYTYFGAVQASAHFFMVAENTYRWDLNDTRSAVSLVDISNPNGTVALRGSVALEGFVQDKFKLREEGGVLSAVSFYQGWWSNTRRSQTRLDNFDVSNPDSPVSLGHLELGLGEQVHATRFDGDRVYVVTFFRIDPLWIVDNSDPTAPVIASELQVPGFSTYLAPLGDRLVTVGLVDNRVSVSLFDVADAKNPALLTQLPVTESGAWSEANWDEKAFTVLPDAGLIMLPVSAGWRGWWGNTNPAEPSGIQLVDLAEDSLTLRGRIPHGFAPRRATVHKGSVLAFSQDSLLTADITDRDSPVVTSDLQLAWRTDRVWHIGKHLVQIGGSIAEADHLLSVSEDNSPDDTLSSFDLGSDMLIASDLRNGYLYIIQQETVPPNVETFAAPSATLRIFDLTSLPRIINVGTLRTDRVNITDTSSRIVWPQDGTLVLVGGNNGWGRIYPVYAMNDVATLNVSAAPSMITSRAIMPWYYPAPAEKYFDQFDVTSAKAPAYVGRETIKTKGWSQFSAPVASNGKVFITRFVSGMSSYPYYRLIAVDALGDGDKAAKDMPPAAEAEDTFANRYALHVLDYNAPGSVIVSEPVGAPGELVGLRDDGKVFYTRGYDYDWRGRGLAGSSVIHASAFDGQKLHLIATLPTNGGEVLPTADKLFTFDWKLTGDAKNEYANFAALYRLEDDGKFKLLDEEKFDGYNTHAFGDVVLAQKYDGYGSALTALDFSNPGDMKNLGSYHLPGWVWVNPATADGTPAEGFWFPLGNYGVLKVELPK